MSDDEYEELLTAAKDALRELLCESEPGTGLQLHQAFIELKRLTSKDAAGSATDAPTRAPSTEQTPADRCAPLRAWGAMPQVERERLLLETIGDAKLSRGQIMTQSVPRPPYESMIKTLEAMVLAGELLRVNERPATGGRSRYVYSRAAPCGPILGLEKAFHAASSWEGDRKVLPGGLSELLAFGMDTGTHNALARAAVLTVADIEGRSDWDLIAVRGFAAGRLRMTREAVGRYRASRSGEHPASGEAATADASGGSQASTAGIVSRDVDEDALDEASARRVIAALRSEEHAREGRQLAVAWRRLVERVQRDYPTASS